MLVLKPTRVSIMFDAVLNPVVLILSAALCVVWSYYLWCVFGNLVKYYVRGICKVNPHSFCCCLEETHRAADRRQQLREHLQIVFLKSKW